MKFELLPGIFLENSTLPVIAGPCVIEDETNTLEIAKRLSIISFRTGTPIVFKASFDKANRTSIKSFRGVGLKKGLEVLRKVKEETNLFVTTDVHEPWQCDTVAEVCDIIQIPAFLSRQTDLITAAAKTGKAINIKKGQFLAPEDMKYAVEKATACGNFRVVVTERGTCFGYHDLVVDMRSFTILKELGIHVFYDATHSVQQPGAKGSASGGKREFIKPLAMAAVAAGADGIFLETHSQPEKAKSDKETQIPLSEVERLIVDLLRIKRTLYDG